MEFLLIGESKLKIVLSEEEVRECKLSKLTGEGCDANLRRSFWKMLDSAKSVSGFDPAGDKVLVQFYPIKDGGGEVFVTKLGLLPDYSAKLLSKSDRISLLSKRNTFYEFTSLEDLIAATRAVKNVSGDAAIGSEAYYIRDKYFLSVEEYGKSGEPLEFPCLLEFGISLPKDISAYIKEHAHRLSDGGAIELFSKM